MSLLGQNFEGEIKYEIKYFRIDNGKEVQHNDLKNIAGTKSILLVKNGYEKQITNSQHYSITVLSLSENRMYYKNSPKNDTLFFFDLNKFHNTPFDYEVIKNVDTIAGYPCNKLIYKNSGDNNMTFYYAPELSLDPKYYMNVRISNHNKLKEIMKSYFLRSDNYAGELVIRRVANEVIERKISDKELTLPPHKVLIEKYGR